MEPALLGIVLDSSVLIAAERRNLRPDQAIESMRKVVGEIAIVLSVVTVAEIGHGIYRANTSELRDRRRAFVDELKATVPIYPVTETTAEIVARIGGSKPARGSGCRSRTSSSGHAPWNWAMQLGPATSGTLFVSQACT